MTEKKVYQDMQSLYYIFFCEEKKPHGRHVWEQYRRWSIRLTRQSTILGPSVILGYDQGLDLKTCLACQYIVISAGWVREGRKSAGTMTEVPVGRAVGRWILNRLSDGAGNRWSACEIFAANLRSRSVRGSSLVIYAMDYLSLSCCSWYASGSRRTRRS